MGKPPFPNLDAPGGRVPRLPVASILRVRPELPHLLRFPSLKGPLMPGGLQRGSLALGYEGVPLLPHAHAPQGKMAGAQTPLLWGLSHFSLSGLTSSPRAPTPGAEQS